jgi:outer membrane protein OmpA-like peptidoglycan-associated protein
MGHLKKILIAIALCLLASVSFAEASSDVVSEQIYFLEEDGRHALVYTTNRSNYTNYNMWFQSREGFEAADYVRDFLYIYPNEYTWDSNSKKGFTLLKFPGKIFAGLERIELESGLQITEDSVFHFNNWRDKIKTPDGHYGVWNNPDNFEKVAYTWVFPATLEPVEYRANRDGEWVQRHNTITYYGADVNDLVFEIIYQPSSHKTYELLQEKLANEEVEISQEPTGVKITVAATVLYPSGVAELSDKGKSLLSKVAETLKDRDDVNILVDGHTDNVPIRGKLASKFPTNWELASIRSINVVHFLADNGIKEHHLASRSFSYYRPIASNDTEDGKEQNRRIELLIEENSGE